MPTIYALIAESIAIIAIIAINPITIFDPLKINSLAVAIGADELAEYSYLPIQLMKYLKTDRQI